MNTNFKQKKKHLKKTIHSIQNLHLTKLKYFENLQKTLPNKLKSLQILQQNTFDTSYCHEFYKNKAQITELNKSINDIKNKTEENDYWINSYPIYVKYQMTNDNQISSNGIIEMSSNSEKQEIFHDYLLSINRYDLTQLLSVNHKVNLTCPCGSTAFLEELSFVICSNCGTIVDREINSNSLSYKETQETEYVSQYYYKRLNHFNEVLSQLQAKENTTIPEHVFDCIKEEIVKKRLNLNQLTLKMIKAFLKKNNLSKYTENSHTILYKLTGKNKITMSPELEEKLKQMFNDIQTPFEKYKGKRKNFLNYNYCFYKFFELLGLPEYLSFFPLLKDRHKLFEHDVIWKQICLDINWDFTACR